jgi:hypothetical protein
MQSAIEVFLNGVCCPSSVARTNFDVTIDWSTLNVTNQATFETFLSSFYQAENGILNDLTNIVISDFSLVGRTLKCNLTADGTTLTLGQGYIGANQGQINDIGNINGLLYFDANYANAVVSNDITYPSTLITIDYTHNIITDFNPVNGLPNGLQHLILNYNQISRFAPSTPMPSTLLDINLNSNLLDHPDPFNPNTILCLGLNSIDLRANSFVSTATTNLANWANTLVSTGGTVYFEYNNIPPASFETALLAKSWAIIY